MARNSYHLEHSIHSDESDNQSISTWYHRNWLRLLFVAILAVLTVGTTTFLFIVLYKGALKEKSLAEKKKSWTRKWNKIEPFVKHFPLGFMLGFIRNLIVLAIERHVDV
ncbi:unnamed protein product [Rotaria socialis]|uniref:Uncharacterized protein n=1 Tax=Rotaria socialis TaxID=392032 RepID=A0A817VS92_9BILA|nr:unnamed protein product [Rotaria socialis]CAF3421510.1 unnamed protein product [Rotaria socialis]CAF3623429.1 unnamed protein product [Rotaria socialis]CAF4237783.1 unnamed protein product [Rotaria socialis]CAF4319605.1 unnamed protein product [Rotaria socialis]